MDPLIQPADFFRPVDTQFASALDPPRDRPSGGFDDYLQAARSATERSRLEAPAESLRSAEDEPADTENRESDAPSESRSQRPEATGHPQENAATAPVLLKAAVSETPAGEATDGPATRSLLVSAPTEHTQSGDGQQQASEPRSGTAEASFPSLAERAASTSEKVSSTGDPGPATASRSAGVSSDQALREANEPRRSQAATEPEKTAVADSSGRESKAAARTSELRQADLQGRVPRDAALLARPAADSVEQSAVRVSEPHPVVQRETLHQQKIDASLADRREGGSGESASGERRFGAGAADPSTSAAFDRVAAAAGSAVEGAHALQTASVLSGEGDGPAASVARFLIAGTTSSSAGITSTSGAQTSSQILVGQLLGAGADGAGSIENTARVLNASGSNGRFQVTLQLDPPELGQLKVHLRMHDQGMVLRVDAETQSVARLIDSRLSELREALAAQGVRLDRADVVVRSSDGGADVSGNRDGGHSAHSQFGGAESGAEEDSSSRHEGTNGGAGSSMSDEFGEGGVESREQPDRLPHANTMMDDEIPASEPSVDLVA